VQERAHSINAKMHWGGKRHTWNQAWAEEIGWRLKEVLLGQKINTL
jgi:hypothetical protein